jgi:hypothetical protein
MASETENKKQLLIGRILVRAEKLAFTYRLTYKDRRDWLRDNGYRDRIYKILQKRTLPELYATNWPDDKICEIIELATPEIAASATAETNEPPPSSSQKSKGFAYEPPYSISIDDLPPMPKFEMPKFESPMDDFLTKSAKRDRIQAETDLLREISKDIKDKRDKRI